MAYIQSEDDVEALRAWALGALARGDALAAVDTVCDIPASDDQVDHLVGLEAEIRVRAGISTGDREQVLASMLCDPLLHPRAMLARAVGADWLAQLSEAEYGPSARFHQGMSMVATARVSARAALESADRLTPEQAAEARAVLDRLARGAWRSIIPATARRVVRRAGSPALREVALRLRDLRPDDPAFSVELLFVLAALARACEPEWPAVGGPWWSSPTFGLIADVATPVDAASRHRFALADCFLELEVLPAAAAVCDPHQLARDALGIAESAVAHAVRAGRGR